MTDTYLTAAAILDSNGRVMADAQLPPNVRTVEIAGARAADGGPVNRKTFKVSRSKRNLDAARQEMTSAIAFEHAGETYYQLTD